MELNNYQYPTLNNSNSQSNIPSSNGPSFYKSIPINSTNNSPPYDNSSFSQSMRSKLSAMQWEEESTYCYQIFVNGHTVSRRKDNNYINCTKLLNLCSLSRGKRDGVLKQQKDKLVVRTGSMCLKGVWCPLDKSRQLANKFGVTNLVFPLFEESIEKFYGIEDSNYGGHYLDLEISKRGLNWNSEAVPLYQSIMDNSSLTTNNIANTTTAPSSYRDKVPTDLPKLVKPSSYYNQKYLPPLQSPVSLENNSDIEVSAAISMENNISLEHQNYFSNVYYNPYPNNACPQSRRQSTCYLPSNADSSYDPNVTVNINQASYYGGISPVQPYPPQHIQSDGSYYSGYNYRPY